MGIDYTEFVQAPEGQKTLRFPEEKQQANFELGVSMVIHKWDDLKTAVDNQWGGPDSAEKRDWISSVVVDLFTNEAAVDVCAIEESLLYAMINEFEVDLEDDSALLVAKQVIDLYKECRERKYDNVHAMYNRWLEKQQQREQANKVDLDSDEEDEEEHEEAPQLVQDTEMMEVDEPAEPIVDEDGFELVQKGRRRR